MTKIEDEFKQFVKNAREAEAKKNRKEKEDLITKQLKELVGDEVFLLIPQFTQAIPAALTFPESMF